MMRALTRKIPLPAALTRFVGECRGVSAVEFALIAPLMISLYFGCAEVSDAIAVDRKVSLIAGTLANLTASCGDSTASGGCPSSTTPPNNITNTEMNNIFAAATAIATPYSSGPLTMRLSCIAIGSDGKVTVPWSATSGSISKLTTFTFSDTETSLKVNSTQLIYAEVSYAYTPIVGTSFIPNLTLSDHMFMTPRNSTPAYNGTTCPPP
jgi:Flp pilus assembly protein TadG